jgi:predicted permease
VAAQLNWPVLLFTFGLAVLTGVIFGLAPAMQATKVNLAPALKEVRSGAATARRTRFGLRFGPGHALVVVQVAMSLLLAVAAGLFVRTLASLNAIDLGFNRENLLTFTIDARQAGYRDQALGTFYGNLLARFRTIPGVKSASLSDFLLVSQHWNDEPIAVPGYTPPPGEKPSSAELRVDAAFFPTMQIPILVGRGFEPRDMASPRVAVVNELFAKKYFPGANPVGRRIGVGDGNAADIEIIGVAKNAHYNSIQEETPTVVYAPYTQNLPDLRGVSCEIRTVGDPAAVAATVRRVVHDANPTIPMDDVTTQAAVIDATISQQRTFADLCSGFAILALAIASVGLYGTMAYGVARRTGEIGIRMALGAKPGGVIWMVLRQVIVLTAIGLAIGLAAARESGHVVESFLYGVKSKDLFVTAGSAGLLAAAALIAGLGPAWRASRIDPVAALRHE